MGNTVTRRMREREATMNPGQVWSVIFAEVVAWYDRRGLLHPSDERGVADELTEAWLASGHSAGRMAGESLRDWTDRMMTSGQS